jgi:hypothetical protein
MPGRGWLFFLRGTALRGDVLGGLLFLRGVRLLPAGLPVLLLCRADVPPRVPFGAVLRLVLCCLRVVGFLFAIAQMFTL